MKRITFILLCNFFLAINIHSQQIFPGQGVEFSQIDFEFQNFSQIDSRYGLVSVDINTLTDTLSLSTGYLNIVSPNGWVVQNLLIDSNSNFPGISMMFDLGSTADIPLENMYAELFSEPLMAPPVGGGTIFPFGNLPYNAEGSESPRINPPNGGIDLSGLDFSALNGITDINWQTLHPNIEQGINQCGPAAVANSLAWLENENALLMLPHNHQAGVRDNSLVGQLDIAMNRTAGNVVTSAQNYLRGKLKYIDENDLENEIAVKHKQRDGITWLSMNITEGDVTSELNSDADLSLIDWIIEEVKSNKNVEIRIGWTGGGGHYIDIVGAGRVKGEPWIAWVHDAEQGDNSRGTSYKDAGIEFSYVIGNKITSFMNGTASSATIDYATSEEYISPFEPVPTLSQWGLIILALLTLIIGIISIKQSQIELARNRERVS